MEKWKSVWYIDYWSITFRRLIGKNRMDRGGRKGGREELEAAKEAIGHTCGTITVEPAFRISRASRKTWPLNQQPPSSSARVSSLAAQTSSAREEHVETGRIDLFAYDPYDPSNARASRNVPAIRIGWKDFVKIAIFPLLIDWRW